MILSQSRKISGFTLKTKASTLCGGFKVNLEDSKPTVQKKTQNQPTTQHPLPKTPKKASKINPGVLEFQFEHTTNLSVLVFRTYIIKQAVPCAPFMLFSPVSHRNTHVHLEAKFTAVY